MTRILVTGREGQLGYELRRFAWPEGVSILAPEREALDLCSAAAVKRFVADNGVSAIVNAAAYTAVDNAEKDVSGAFAVNALAPAALAEAAREADAPLVHVSTDYVFNGSATEPYEVDAAIDPVGVYGASKAAGEFAVRLSAPRSAIVRTAWVVSARRSNFLRTMLRLGQEREVLRVVSDQRGAPTFAGDLAEALAAITLAMLRDRNAPTGLFHFTNRGVVSWHGFAAAIFEEAAARGLKTPRLEAITTQDYPTPARRPAYSALSAKRIEADYAISPRPWRDGLGRLVEDSLENGL